MFSCKISQYTVNKYISQFYSTVFYKYISVYEMLEKVLLVFVGTCYLLPVEADKKVSSNMYKMHDCMKMCSAVDIFASLIL